MELLSLDNSFLLTQQIFKAEHLKTWFTYRSAYMNHNFMPNHHDLQYKLHTVIF